jgi:glycosyltransferase involved in cell wall biosynthesis
MQYLPLLQSHGIHCTVSPLLDDAYLARRFQVGYSSFGIIARKLGRDILGALLRRTKAVLSSVRYDLVILHMEAFPWVPPFFEDYLCRCKVPYVYDYDDAVFHNYDQHSRPMVRRVLGGKIRRVIAGAACVFAGSRYLADYARQTNPVVHLMPTVIDLNRYPYPRPSPPANRPFTVGWIGSPFAAEAHLRLVEAPLSQFCKDRGARFVTVGAGPRCPLSFDTMEQRPWSEETEVAEVAQFDVGIMPVRDGPFERGKCGFKLIQYMACGIPVIASPVGENCAVVEDGVNGFLADTPAEWRHALEILHRNAALREQMGAAGRRKVETSYCVQVTGPRLTTVLHDLLARTPRSVSQPSRSAVPLDRYQGARPRTCQTA